MQADVVVVGSYVQDLVWRCQAFPRPGETVVGTFSASPGGKGSNQAIAASRAGARTAFLGAIGDDAFGHAARALHATEGITASWSVKRRHPTGTAGILVNATGENQITVSLGANAALRPSDLDRRLLEHARVAIAQAECNLAAAARALQIASRARVLTIFNPAPLRTDLPLELLADVDVLVPNETELAGLLRLVAPRRFRRIDAATVARAPAAQLHTWASQLHVPVVIVTRGARGCLLSRKDGYLELPAHPVAAVDTTGAGDAFVGALAAGLIHAHGDLAAAARFASAAAALAVTRPGAAPSMPPLRAIQALLRRPGVK